MPRGASDCLDPVPGLASGGCLLEAQPRATTSIVQGRKAGLWDRQLPAPDLPMLASGWRHCLSPRGQAALAAGLPAPLSLGGACVTLGVMERPPWVWGAHRRAAAPQLEGWQIAIHRRL